MFRSLSLRGRFPGILALGVLALAACGGTDEARPSATPTRDPDAVETPLRVEQATLRLGYFANITHAIPVTGVASGEFEDVLGPSVKLETKVFNAGPAVIEAMFAGEIDASYIGPNPAINGFIRSNGKALKVIAGAASGGALFVVKPGITDAKSLANKRFATPQLGNTQDVALRAWLHDNGYKLKEEGGNVTVVPTANADALTLFKKGDIDGAWLPEPWATRLINEAGAKVLIDERTLWPGGRFVTTHLIVRTEFYEKNPGVVEALVRATVKQTEWINANPEAAKKLTNDTIKQLTGAGLSQEVIDGAWPNITFTHDPIAESLKASATAAYELGFLGSRKPNLDGIYDLQPLNKVLRELRLPEVSH